MNIPRTNHPGNTAAPLLPAIHFFSRKYLTLNRKDTTKVVPTIQKTKMRLRMPGFWSWLCHNPVAYSKSLNDSRLLLASLQRWLWVHLSFLYFFSLKGKWLTHSKLSWPSKRWLHICWKWWLLWTKKQLGLIEGLRFSICGWWESMEGSGTFTEPWNLRLSYLEGMFLITLSNPVIL
jgi:hypothetical protein